MEIPFFKELEVGEVIEPITDDKITTVENKYKIKLPSSYIQFLGQQNGGYINYSVFPELKGDIEIESLSGIYGNRKFKNIDIIEESDYYIKEWDLPSNILLLTGDGHWWICLDYRDIANQGEPKISYIDSENNIDIVIADNFKEFITKLTLK